MRNRYDNHESRFECTTHFIHLKQFFIRRNDGILVNYEIEFVTHGKFRVSRGDKIVNTLGALDHQEELYAGKQEALHILIQRATEEASIWRTFNFP